MIIKDLEYKTKLFYGQSSPTKFLRILLTDGTSCMILYRIARFFRKIHLGVLSWLFLEINKFLNGCVIGRNAEFAEGLVIMHSHGVVINGGVRGGKNVVIESGVVIGAAHHGLPVKVPLLGDNIFIGTGAKILGGIKIGNNVTIGANAVVVKDAPDGATIVGIPGRVIKISEKNNQ